MGICSCGLPVDAGEYVLLRPGGDIHVGCPERTTATGPTAQSEPSGFLFDNMNAKKPVGIKHVSFDGTDVLGIDTPKLAGQLARVFELMRDGKFRSLATIASETGCLETSASSRLRDFRKARFGGHTVVSRQLAGSQGTHEYRLIVREQNQRDVRRNAA